MARTFEDDYSLEVLYANIAWRKRQPWSQQHSRMPSRRRTDSEVEVDGGVPLVARVPKKSARTITAFQSPGLEPDARLIVFKREFHVHSVILKLHSDYFRKFLNSTGEPDQPPSTTFRYDYVSVLSEDDNSWVLLPAVKPSKESTKTKRPSTTSKVNVATEVEAFRKLLCAMYNRPYSIQSIDELNVLTRQSEIYCALPIVSATLTGGLMGSPIFRRQISENRPRNILAGEAPDLLLLARKLRHPVLFRECFVHVVGNWQEESTYGQRPFKPIREDPVLYSLVCQKYMETCSKVLKVNHALFADMMRNPCQEGISFAKESFRADDHPLSGAQFYKEIHRKYQADAREFGDSAVLESLDKLMENNLVLDRSGYGPGEGAYASNFLCANISDDEMPWDTTELHW